MLGLRGQPRGGAPIAPADDLARGLQGVLRSSRARGGVAAVCPGAAQRQRPQVDGSDAGAGDRSGSVSILSAFHHRRSLECRPGMAAAARAGARAHGRPDHRRHQLSQARDPLGRGRAAVLRRAGQGGQLPGGGHRGAVDGRAGLSARGGALSPESVADRRGAHAGQDSRGGALSRTVAAGVGPDPPGARERLHPHGGGGGRRVRRQQPVSRGRAQAGPAVCGGHFVDANRLCRPPAPGPAPRRRAGPPQSLSAARAWSGPPPARGAAPRPPPCPRAWTPSRWPPSPRTRRAGARCGGATAAPTASRSSGAPPCA